MFRVENLIKNRELKILVPHNLMLPVNFQPRLCISNSWDVYLKINDKIMVVWVLVVFFFFFIQNVAFLSLYGIFLPAPDNYQNWI